MKKLFFILTILSLAALSHETSYAKLIKVAELPVAMQKSCSNIELKPELSFYTSYGKLKYNFTKSQNELTKMSEQYGINEQGMFTSGLATVHVSWELTLNTISRIIGQKDICVVPVNINLFIGLTDPTIYISRDLEENTCEYNLVVRHEQTHQQINSTALDFFIPKIKAAAAEISKDIKPVYITDTADINQATQRLTEEYIKKIEPVVEVFKKEILVEQAKLDNVSQYRLEGNLCKNFNNSWK